MINVDLTRSPLIPRASAWCSSTALSISFTPTLMPRLITSYPLLVRMMSTRFLPMSCTSPFTVASTTRPRPPRSDFSISGSRCETADFMVSALCKTKGSCISPLANRSPTTRIPSRRISLTMSRGFAPSAIAVSRSASRPTRAPSMMRRFSRSLSGRSSSEGPVSLEVATPSKSRSSSLKGS